jgi:hypothetical protein
MAVWFGQACPVDVIAKFGTLIPLFEKAICHVTIIASGEVIAGYSLKGGRTA